MLLFLCISCQVKSSQAPMKLDITSEKEVKSVMLYDTIYKWPVDTIQLALTQINNVISDIGFDNNGYSLWRITNDTTQTYRFLIEGSWSNQAAFDSIHANPKFRKELDRNIHIFTETRKWQLYRRFEQVQLIPSNQ